MHDNVFLDSNIMVYSYSELNKQEIARKLITDSNSFISTQVLQELCNSVTENSSSAKNSSYSHKGMLSK